MQYHPNPITDYLLQRYGGKKAFAAFVWHSLGGYAGAFRHYKRIHWYRVSRVIFVCKGNVCRSAFAGSRFSFNGISVTSAGLEAETGKPADVRAAKVARRFGSDLGQHRSTHISELALTDGDLLVAFEPDHAEQLRQLAHPRSGVQTTLVGLWSVAIPIPYVHDPYGLPEVYFEDCFRRIDEGLAGLRLRFSEVRPSLRKMP